jgi:hypothetical protein
VFITINGVQHYLWRAVDQHGDVLDILVTSRRDAKAATRFFRKVLKGLEYAPRVLITDKLRSYPVAHARVMPSVEHRRSKYLNNRGRELPSAHPSAGAGDETLQLTRARATVLVVPRSPGSPHTFGHDATGCPPGLPSRDAHPIRHLERDHRAAQRGSLNATTNRPPGHPSHAHLDLPDREVDSAPSGVRFGCGSPEVIYAA